MKLIPKRQNGGSFLSLFADYRPLINKQLLQVSSSKPASSDKNDTDKGKLTEKDLFTLLKDVDGLPNEMQHLVSSILAMYLLAQLFGDEIDSAGLANIYAKNIYELKHANFNKKEYDKAYNLVKSNEGLNEYAISISGKVMVQDENNNLSLVSVEEYMQNPSEYTAITNSNLLWLRAHDPSQINNNLIFDVVNNGIGINKIEQLIRNRFQSLGTDELHLEKLSSKMSSDVIEGLKVLQTSESTGKDIPLLIKEKVITKSQANLANAALLYIYSTLPENAKAILQLHSGNAKDPKLGALDMIKTMIASKTNRYLDTSYEILDKNANGSGKKSGSGDSDGLDDEKLSIASQFLAGRGNKETVTINPGTNFSITATTNSMQLVKSNGDHLGANCTLLEVSEGQFGPILNLQKATMGGHKIDPSALNKVIIDDGMIRSIDLPIDANGNPDLRPTTIESKRNFDNLLQLMGIDINDQNLVAMHYQEINALLLQNGLPAAYNSDGKLIAGQWGLFAAFNATTTNKVLGLDDLDDTGPFLREVTDDGTIDNLLSILKDKTDNDKLLWDKDDWGWFEGSYDAFIKGTLFIPINVNYFNSQNSAMKTPAMVLLEIKLQELDRLNELQHRYVKPGQL